MRWSGLPRPSTSQLLSSEPVSDQLSGALRALERSRPRDPIDFLTRLLEGDDGKEGCEEGQDVRTCFADFVDGDLELRSALLAAVVDVAKAQRSESPQPEATREALVAALRSSRSDGATSVDVHLGSPWGSLHGSVASEAG